MDVYVREWTRDIQEENMSNCKFFAVHPHHPDLLEDYGVTWRHPAYPSLWFSYKKSGMSAVVQYVHPSERDRNLHDYPMIYIGNAFPMMVGSNSMKFVYEYQQDIPSIRLFETFRELVSRFPPEVQDVILEEKLAYERNKVL